MEGTRRLVGHPGRITEEHAESRHDMTPWLSQEELNDLCKPLTQPAAQIRFIKREFGIVAGRKPSGDPLVFRAELEAARAAASAPAKTNGKPGPNRAALQSHFAKAA